MYVLISLFEKMYSRLRSNHEIQYIVSFFAILAAGRFICSLYSTYRFCELCLQNSVRFCYDLTATAVQYRWSATDLTAKLETYLLKLLR